VQAKTSVISIAHHEGTLIVTNKSDAGRVGAERLVPSGSGRWITLNHFLHLEDWSASIFGRTGLLAGIESFPRSFRDLQARIVSD